MNNTSEQLRLAELESYDLDNGYPKEQLLSIIKLASNICDAPISLIDIIDEFNQRTIVTHGDWEEQVIPRDKSICDKVVVNGDMLIINDIGNNEEISSRLSAEDKEKIKFYAGAPLKSPNGFNMGALCIIDSEPRQLTEFQKESLQVLADEIMARLHLHKQTKSLKIQNSQLEKYSVFLQNSADILCIIDPNTHLILDINEDCYEEIRFTRDEIIQNKFTDFIESDIDIQKAVTSWFHSDKSNTERLSIPVKLKNRQNEEKWYRCNFTSENNQWYLTARNITDQMRAEDRLKGLRSKFDKVTNTTTDLIYDLDWNSATITWSGGLTEIFGYPESDMNVDFEWWKQKVHPDDVEEVINNLTNFIDSNKTIWSATYRFRALDGSYKYVLNNSHIERDSSGNPINILGAIADISKLKKAELEQKNLLSRLRHANHLAGLGFWELDLKNSSIHFDDELYHILGVKRKPKKPSIEIILKRVDKSTKNSLLEFIKSIKNGDGPFELEHRIKTTNQDERFLVHRGELILENGEPSKIIITTQDISERKIKELRITESLKEKEILLSEIHHRVKNNLAIISGLLEINLFKVQDERIIDFIKSSQLRIKSMARIHEKLYESGSFTDISFKDYILGLVKTIQSTLTSDDNEPEIKTNITDVQLNINYAIPCGLVLNELITNSWKHAFPNQKAGTISVSFYRKSEKIHLSVKDNGVGLPDGFEPENAQSMGMTLIKILSQQINARLSIGNTRKGFSSTLTFTQKEGKRGSSSSFV